MKRSLENIEYKEGTELLARFAKALGLDVAKIKAEIAKPEYAEMLQVNRGIGDKLHVQGTPTLIVGEEVIPHAVNVSEIEQKFGKN